MLCNPHNPVGRVFDLAELQQLAELSLRHGMIVCADEIHCGLVLDPEKRHLPFAALGPEVAERTITLMAPSKTFNLAGPGLLVCGHPLGVSAPPLCAGQGGHRADDQPIRLPGRRGGLPGLRGVASGVDRLSQGQPRHAGRGFETDARRAVHGGRGGDLSRLDRHPAGRPG